MPFLLAAGLSTAALGAAAAGLNSPPPQIGPVSDVPMTITLAEADSTQAAPASNAPASPAGGAPALQQSAGTSTASNSAANATVQNVSRSFDIPGVLTPKGTFVFDPALQFATTSSNRVSLLGYTVIPAITIGVIDVRELTRNSLVLSLEGRYGLTNRLEFEGRVPYVIQQESAVERPFGVGSSDPQTFNTHGNGVGDVEFGLRYQLNEPEDGGPYYIGGLHFVAPTGRGPFDVPYSSTTGLQTEIPTGSGFWGIQPSIGFVLPSDPAVFYGRLSYQWNVKKNVNKTIVTNNNGVLETTAYGTVDPGDVLGFNFGMGFGINDKASFSIGYDHNIVMKTKINGVTPTDAMTVQVGSLVLGYSYRLSSKQTASLLLGVGVTPEAPNVQLTFRAPYSF